jgi:hypothetical protein
MLLCAAVFYDAHRQSGCVRETAYTGDAVLAGVACATSGVGPFNNVFPHSCRVTWNGNLESPCSCALPIRGPYWCGSCHPAVRVAELARVGGQGGSRCAGARSPVCCRGTIGIVVAVSSCSMLLVVVWDDQCKYADGWDLHELLRRCDSASLRHFRVTGCCSCVVDQRRQALQLPCTLKSCPVRLFTVKTFVQPREKVGSGLGGFSVNNFCNRKAVRVLSWPAVIEIF